LLHRGQRARLGFFGSIGGKARHANYTVRTLARDGKRGGDVVRAGVEVPVTADLVALLASFSVVAQPVAVTP